MSYKLIMLLSFVILVFSPGAIAQAEFSETIKFEAGINPDGKLEFTNRSFNTAIKTWNNNYVELQMHVRIKASKQQDIDETLRAIRQIEFQGNDSLRSIKTIFWKSINSNMNRNKMNLNTGKTVILKKFDIENTLYIPKSISLVVENKYADIQMEDITGDVDFKIYSGKIYCLSIGGNTTLDLRYSKAFIETLREASFQLYDSDIEIQTCGNFTVESKYSKVEILNAGDMQFESYDDKFTIGKLGTVKGTAKYSEFDFGPSINLFFDFYDSNLKAGETGIVKGKSKYSEFNVGSANAVTLESSYDDSFSFDTISSITIKESKYSDYTLASVDGDIILNGYDDKLTVEKISDAFNHISLDGKYGDFRLNIPNEIGFRLLVDMKHGKIDYPSEKFERKTYIKENSKLFIDAGTKKPGDKNVRLVEIKGYDNKVVIVN